MQVDLEFLSHLARIRLTKEETVLIQEDLRSTLQSIRLLKEVDLRGVEPTFRLAVPGQAGLREDAPLPCLPQESVLSNVPASDGPYILVPREGPLDNS